MKVKDVRGREVAWKLSGCRVLGDETRPRSGPHKRAREVIRRAFPTDQVLEEVPIPGSKLRGDFLLPRRPVMVEVHGRQHFEMVAHFHGGPHGFRQALANDRQKAAFCEANGITLIILRDTETDEQWLERLRSC